MKKIILVIMVLLGATICNAQTQKVKTKSAKPIPGQTPPQVPPKKTAPQVIKAPAADSTKNKVDSSKSRKRKRPIPQLDPPEKERQ